MSSTDTHRTAQLDATGPTAQPPRPDGRAPEPRAAARRAGRHRAGVGAHRGGRRGGGVDHRRGDLQHHRVPRARTSRAARTSPPARLAPGSAARTSRRRERVRRVSALELSFLAPGLIFLIFLTIQAGLFFYGKAVAIQAAREGVSQLRLAPDAATYEDVDRGVVDNTQSFATTVGREALHRPRRHPDVRRGGRPGGDGRQRHGHHAGAGAGPRCHRARRGLHRALRAGAAVRRARGGRRDDERGSLAVEMAIVVPVDPADLRAHLRLRPGGERQRHARVGHPRRRAQRHDRALLLRGGGARRARGPRGHRRPAALVPELAGGDRSRTRSWRASRSRSTASCTYPLADLGLPGAPGDVTPESSFTSMLDPYRGVE